MAVHESVQVGGGGHVNRSVLSYGTQDVPVDGVVAADVPQSDGAV